MIIYSILMADRLDIDIEEIIAKS
ncbi:MAG: hypothetical protein ACOCVD_02500 [Bacillota bacterium]